MPILRRTILALVLIAALAWPADYAVWLLRGSPTSNLVVARFVVAALKGNKEEYYPDGTATVACSRSLFPQTGSPCWYLSGHRVVYER